MNKSVELVVLIVSKYNADIKAEDQCGEKKKKKRILQKMYSNGTPEGALVTVKIERSRQGLLKYRPSH